MANKEQFDEQDAIQLELTLFVCPRCGHTNGCPLGSGCNNCLTPGNESPEFPVSRFLRVT